MSGHSKWHNIQKTKGAADAKRSAAFTKIAKEIIVAVKEGGGSGDPANSSRLATVIAIVKGFGMPRLKSDARGDLFAHIAVEVPKKLSKRERELLEELAAEMGEDVNEEKRSPLQKLRDIFE